MDGFFQPLIGPLDQGPGSVRATARVERIWRDIFAHKHTAHHTENEKVILYIIEFDILM